MGQCQMLCTSPGRLHLSLPLSINTVCQARFALSEAMLAVTSHLLVLHVPEHSFQEDLLYDLARHRGETDWPVVPWVFLFSLFKNGSYVSPFPFSGKFTGLPGLLKYDRVA